MTSRQIEILRGIAILAVIGVHTAGNWRNMHVHNGLYWANLGGEIFCRFAVPLFLLISGYVLAMKYYGGFSKKQFYQKRLKVIVWPYLTFSLIYIVLYAVAKQPPTLAQAVWKLGTGEAAEHLWFFRLIFELYLLYPWIIRLYETAEKEGGDKMFLLTSYLFQVFINLIIKVSQNTTGGSKFALLLTFGQFFFYFAMGVYVLRKWDKVSAALQETRLHSVYLVFAAAALTMVHALLYSRADIWALLFVYATEPVLFLGTMALFYRLIGRLQGLQTLCLNFGFYSFGIYLIHLIWMAMVVRALKAVHITSDQALFYPALFIGTGLLSLVSIFGLHKTALSPYLLGLPAGGSRHQN